MYNKLKDVNKVKNQTIQEWLESKGLDEKTVTTTAPAQFRNQMSLYNKKKNKASTGFMAAVNRQR